MAAAGEGGRHSVGELAWRGAAGRGRGDADNDKLHDFTLDEASYEGAHERLVRRQRRAVHSAVLRILNVISK
jgi:hypothetical protein